MIIQKKTRHFNEPSEQSFINVRQLLKILEVRDEFKDDLIKAFSIAEDSKEIFRIDNAKSIVKALSALDSDCRKIDISSELGDVYLLKMLEEEKSIYKIYSLKDENLVKLLGAGSLEVETRYSAKSDLLDYHNLSKFAKYCQEHEYNDLIEEIRDYLRIKDKESPRSVNLRLVYKYEDQKYYLRAVTSDNGYRDFGINFSVFVAIVALGRYAENSGEKVYIDHYSISDSELYVSFQFSREIPLKNGMFLSTSIILENDEIKRSSVSFNGVYKLRFVKNEKESEIVIKPNGLRQKDKNYEVDLLRYPHRGNVSTVMEKTKELPNLIELFRKQATEDAPIIASKKDADSLRDLIFSKVKNARKKEFIKYKGQVLTLMTKVSVDNMFVLFDMLRQVDDLFESDDIVSRDFWRNKVYEVLVKGE
jgi:hypothetical protein